jgi:hypothetical protein
MRGDPDHDPDHVGLLVIRAWIEAESSEPLRAHIRLTNDVSTGFEREFTVASTDEVGTTVQNWLADVLRHSSEAGR